MSAPTYVVGVNVFRLEVRTTDELDRIGSGIPRIFI
jgi:hypothetical protein